MQNLYCCLIPAAIRISVPERASPEHKEELGMSAIRINLRRLGIRKSQASGIVALYALLGLLTLAVMAGLLATPRSTGEQADYTGPNIQVRETRRLAETVRGDDTDTIVFGYEMQAGDMGVPVFGVKSLHEVADDVEVEVAPHKL